MIISKSRTQKITVLFFLLVFVITAFFAISSEGIEDTSPEIISQNVAYTGDFSLMYAVSDNAVSPVTLYIYDELPTASSVPINTYVTSNVTYGETSGLKNMSGTPIDAYIFKTEGVVAAQMVKNFYIKAVGADGKESGIKRYSVAEYLYERLSTETITSAQRKLYKEVIDFGDAAQAILTPEETSIMDYRYVKIIGGFIDGFSTGVYPIGTKLSPKSETESCVSWTHTIYDADKNPIKTSFAETFTVADSVINLITFGDIKVNKVGTEDFEKYNPSSNVLDVIPGLSVSDANVKFSVDATYGNLVEVNYPTQKSTLYIQKNDEIVSINDATGFEFSFDFKSVCNDNSINALEILFDVGATAKFDIRIILKNGEANNELTVYNNSNADETKTYTGTDSREFNNIRFVAKYDEEFGKNVVLYAYINGSDVPQVIPTTYGAISDITKLTRVRVKPEPSSRSAGISILMDNIYCGFIKE